MILFRPDYSTEEELAIAKKFFDVETLRSKCPSDSTIIGRYSVLPYYKELEEDLATINSRLINSYQQHKWIANFEYYEVLKEYTFETWKQNELANNNYDGPYVVKGCTNSKKHKWNKLMFAQNKRAAIEIGIELSQDGLIGQQELLYRKYEPLKEIEIGIDGLPFSHEWRFFFLYGDLVDYGFYWSNAQDAEKLNEHNCDDKCYYFAKKIADITKHYANFVVIDVAEKANGEYVLVELNDAQMSGLSMIRNISFYCNLERVINEASKTKR